MTRRTFNAMLWFIAVALFIVGPAIAVQGIAATVFLLWAFVEYRDLAQKIKE